MGIVDWLRDIAHSAPIQCKEPNDPTTLALSLFIVVGMFFSYLPQHIKIIRLKSSDGLSPWYQLLGCIASASVVQNAFILQFGLFKCCEIFSAGKCAESLLALVQLSVQMGCIVTTMILFIIFFPKERKHIIGLSSGEICMSYEYSRAVYIGIAVASYTSLIVVISVIMVATLGDASASLATEIWADILGLVSLVISVFQFFPQLFQTYVTWQVGALSIPSMCMQTPGSFILVYTLAVRPGTNASTWITYLFTGILQFILLSMCLIITFQNRSRLNGEDPDLTPLLLDKAAAEEALERLEEEEILISPRRDVSYPVPAL
eukprot:Partr_v1_DN26737_c1_g1_i3_m8679 putative PQ loop repeat protein